ncbi:hypothetical protein MP638_004900 [Amoeboaphelidium occidentale]|nr:hypothetical protein MP638_004900 [Amoeboaphelidium occidentale]
MPTEEQLSEFKEAFSLYDKKGSGSVEPAVVGDLLRAVGQNPTNAQVAEVVSSLKGPVTFDLFVNDILNRNGGQGFKPQTSVEEFVQGFQVFDKDGNGFIPVGELRYVLTSLGEKLSDEEVDELLKVAEVDKNGLVNYEQFVRLILSG